MYTLAPRSFLAVGPMKNGSAMAATPALPNEEQEAIRRQLDKILSSSLFRNSKRFPDFLRYTVEHTLTGNIEDIKERVLGIEVFGRDPDYDTNLDPVVRMTAVEVRKRLAQYYQGAGRENEVRIDLSRGSYIPEFRFPKEPARVSVPVAADVAPSPASGAASPSDIAVPRRFRYKVAGVVAAILMASALLAWAFLSRGTVVDRFWNPLVGSSTPVLVCIPDLSSRLAPTADNPLPNPMTAALAALPAWFRLDRVSFSDALTLSELTGVLGSKGQSFRVRRTDDAKLQDLEEGPVILIGGLSNPWTRQLGTGLRFAFAVDGDMHYISDRQNPSARNWAVITNHDEPAVTAPEDFALISRVFDPTTGHPLITAAGLLPYGTEAAGECLADLGCLQQLEKLAPGDWKKKNIQFVIGTKIIGDSPGQARVLAAYLW